MPLEVREIGIHMRVGDNDAAEPSNGAASDGLDDEAREAIVEDCVRRVLAMLKVQRER